MLENKKAVHRVQNPKNHILIVSMTMKKDKDIESRRTVEPWYKFSVDTSVTITYRYKKIRPMIKYTILSNFI